MAKKWHLFGAHRQRVTCALTPKQKRLEALAGLPRVSRLRSDSMSARTVSMKNEPLLVYSPPTHSWSSGTDR